MTRALNKSFWYIGIGETRSKERTWPSSRGATSGLGLPVDPAAVEGRVVELHDPPEAREPENNQKRGGIRK